MSHIDRSKDLEKHVLPSERRDASLQAVAPKGFRCGTSLDVEKLEIFYVQFAFCVFDARWSVLARFSCLCSGQKSAGFGSVLWPKLRY